MTIDWILAAEESEKKLVSRRFQDGGSEFLLITKDWNSGLHRTSLKARITEMEYRSLAISSLIRVEKRRYEFGYLQKTFRFACKYDEFPNCTLRILEIDAIGKARADSFDPSDFPYALIEVTGDKKYYGFRIAKIL